MTSRQQQKNLCSQQINRNNIFINHLPLRYDQKKTPRNKINLSPLSNINKQAQPFFYNNQDNQEKLETNGKPPKAYITQKTESILYQCFENQKVHQQKIEKGEAQNMRIEKCNFNSQGEQFQIQNINSNYTLPTTRKQSNTKINQKNQLFQNQDNQSFQIKTKHTYSFQQDFQCKQTNSMDQDENIQQFKPNNYQKHRQSINIEQQNSYETERFNNTQQKSKMAKKFDLIRQNSIINLQNQQNKQSIQEETQRNQQYITSNSINKNEKFFGNQLSINKKSDFNKQLEQIFLNNTKYLFLKCKNENCNYFCILTSFHREDYYCQQCEMLSVIGDVAAKIVKNKCNHSLNYRYIIEKVQEAIKNKELAHCNSCKQEIHYTLIKSIDIQKKYFELKQLIDVQILKNKILKTQQFEIAECTEPECDFFTIWNSSKPILKQGLCIPCNKRIAFKMEPSLNLNYQINCGHTLTTQKLLCLVSDAYILKDLAKCPQCNVQISLKFFKEFQSQGGQYIEYALKRQLNILKQQFDKKKEIVLSQCSTNSCPFFYVFQNKTIYASKNKIAFSKQFNFESTEISSFCPICNQFSIQNEYIQRKQMQRIANIQLKYD